MSELEDAVERLSAEMMNRVEVVETPLPGGLVASESFVRVSYNDLRIALARLDQIAPRRCTVCTATVAEFPEAMCCHCQELPWRLLNAPNYPAAN